MTDPEKSPTASSIEGNAPLAGMLSAVLSNPEMMEKIKEIVGSATSGTGAPTVVPESAPNPKNERTEGDNGAENALSVLAGSDGDGLATMLSNPELLSKLPQMMSLLRPMLEGGAGLKPVSAPTGGIQKKSSEDCRNELLCALKPFLSPERRRAVDAMLRISQLGNVIRHIK